MKVVNFVVFVDTFYQQSLSSTERCNLENNSFEKMTLESNYEYRKFVGDFK